MTNGPASLLDDGIRALQAGEMDRALSLLNAAVASSPADGRAHGYLGICKARRGDLAGSVTSLQEAARLQPSDPMAQFNLAVALMQAQRTDEARAAFQAVLALDPSNAKAQQGLQQLGGTAPAQPAPTAAPPAWNPQARGVDLSAPAGSYDQTQPVSTQPPGPATLTGEPYAPQPSMQPAQPLGGQPYQQPTQTFPPPAQPYPPQGQPYQQPGYGAPQPSPYPPQPAGGMRYTPPVQQFAPAGAPPSAGLRIARGLGWGFLWGQWWTVLNLFWAFVWGGVNSLGGKHENLVLMGVILGVIFVLVFGVAGAVVGLIIGAMNAPVQTGAVIGIVFGLIFCGLEVVLGGFQPGMLINIFFWFYTGRYVGAKVAMHVQRPVIT